MNSSTNSIDIKFEHTSAMLTEANRMQSMHNLMVCNFSSRCFSPMTQDIFSPGISPIGAPEDLKDLPNFKFPMPKAQANVSNNSPRMGAPQQQQQQSPLLEYKENASFELDLSASTEMMSNLEASTRSETSNVSNVLNHTMDMSALLKSVGLEAYREKFAKAGIDLQTFLKMTPSELKSLEFQSEADRKAIIDMLNIFN